jgi:glutathione S-transferase
MALAHKGLECDARPTRFTDIQAIAEGIHKTVPIIEDGDRIVGDSWEIAKYLETTYGDRPALFGEASGVALTSFVQAWVVNVLHRGIQELIIFDIYKHLDVADQPYFRATREQRLGRRLEQVQADRESRVVDFRSTLRSLRQVLERDPWLGGASPLYADYLVFGGFQWARVVSPFPLLANDDVIAAWFERCLDLYDGLGRCAVPSP